MSSPTQNLIPMIRFQHLIITGGTGYIGTRLAQLAIAAGFRVTILSRTRKGLPLGANFVSWSLGEGLPIEALSGDAHLIALFHLAHDWDKPPSQQITKSNLNLTATKTLLDSCRALGVARFVFVSSQSARFDAPNIYGRVKWETEQLLDGEDTISARVGLVYGGPRKGMFGLLCKLVKFPIIPMVSPSQFVQPIHLDELCSGLLLLAQSRLSGWKGLAGPIPVTFGNVLRSLARIGHGRHLVVLPIPLSLALLGCHLSRYIPGMPTIDKERILGLVGTKTIHTRDDLAELGLEIVPIEIGLSRSSLCRKGLLMEGNVLLRYVLGKKPSCSLLLRYVKAIRLMHHDNEPFGLPPFVIAYPALLRFIEPFNTEHPLAKRLALATALSEASSDGAQAFLTAMKPGKTVQLLRLTISLVIDICVKLVRLLLSHRRKDD
jgi:nucleoside-diphosphate-sugar epimerase